jgi:hypothetical protein
MFSSDHFHPSAEGYARAAAVVLPTLLAALGEDDRPPVTPAEGGVLSLPEAAHEAVRAAGTEVSAARGPAGRWAVLRRHPWFGEPRLWFGHHRAPAPAAPAGGATVPSGRSASSAVGWTPEDH